MVFRDWCVPCGAYTTHQTVAHSGGAEPIGAACLVCGRGHNR